MTRPTTARVRRHRIAGARQLLAPTAGLVALLLSGCGLKTLVHPLGLVDRRSPTREATKLAPLDETRARASADATEPYWTYHLGELYVAADSLPEAETALRAALARDPTYAPALALLSKIYYQTGRYPQGVDLLDAARVRFPDGLPPELLAGLALHYDALGRRDLATRTMAAVPRARAGDAGVFVTMRGDAPDSAGAAAAANVREHPTSAASQNNQGIAQLRAGDPESASTAFLKAIELDPSLPGPYYNLAILEKYYRLDAAAAERWYLKYRERATDDPDGLAQAFDRAQPKPVAEKKDVTP